MKKKVHVTLLSRTSSLGIKRGKEKRENKEIY